MIICVSFWNAAVICNSPVYTLNPADDTSSHSENLHEEKGGGSNPSRVFCNWDICEHHPVSHEKVMLWNIFPCGLNEQRWNESDDSISIPVLLQCHSAY